MSEPIEKTARTAGVPWVDGAHRWTINPAFDRPTARAWLAAPAHFADPPATEVRPAKPGRPRVLRVPAPTGGPPWIVKMYPPAPGWNGVKDWFRPSRAHRAFLCAEWLLARGVPTAVPVAAGELRAGRRVVAAYFITEEVPGGERLRDLRRAPLTRSDQVRLIRALARAIADLHNRACSHSDPTHTNFLVQPHADGFRIVLIDVESIRPKWRVGARVVRRDLAQLFARIPMNAREQLWFIAAYCRARTGACHARALAESLGAPAAGCRA